MSIRLAVKVIPRASHTEIKSYSDGILTVRLAALPVEGAANQALIELLAKTLRLPKNQINLQMGFGGRNKIIDIAGVTREEFNEVINRLILLPRGK